MSKQEDKKVVTGQTDLGDGANSPIDDSNKKQLGHSAPGEEGKGAKTDAEQRKPGANSDSKQEGKTEGVPQAAIDAAQKSADNLASEPSRGAVEAGTGAPS